MRGHVDDAQPRRGEHHRDLGRAGELASISVWPGERWPAACSASLLSGAVQIASTSPASASFTASGRRSGRQDSPAGAETLARMECSSTGTAPRSMQSTERGIDSGLLRVSPLNDWKLDIRSEAARSSFRVADHQRQALRIASARASALKATSCPTGRRQSMVSVVVARHEGAALADQEIEVGALVGLLHVVEVQPPVAALRAAAWASSSSFFCVASSLCGHLQVQLSLRDIELDQVAVLAPAPAGRPRPPRARRAAPPCRRRCRSCARPRCAPCR